MARLRLWLRLRRKAESAWRRAAQARARRSVVTTSALRHLFPGVYLSLSLPSLLSPWPVARDTAHIMHVTLHTHTGGEGAQARGRAQAGGRGRGQARASGGDCTAGAMSVSQNCGRVNNNSV